MEDKSQNFVLELLLPMVPSDRVASNDNNIDGSVSFYVETQSRGCNDGKVVWITKSRRNSNRSMEDTCSQVQVSATLCYCTSICKKCTKTDNTSLFFDFF